MIQTTIFDAIESARRKEEGMALAADNNQTLLNVARGIARELAEAHPDRETHADAVAMALVTRGLPTLGNAAGSLFRGREWQRTGRWHTSERKNAHCNPLRIWRLAE